MTLFTFGYVQEAYAFLELVRSQSIISFDRSSVVHYELVGETYAHLSETCKPYHDAATERKHWLPFSNNSSKQLI